MTFYLLYNQKHDRKSIQISNEESQILWMNQLLRIHGQEVISMNWYLWKRQENRSLFGFWILYQRISKKNKFWEWSSQISRQFDWIYWEEEQQKRIIDLDCENTKLESSNIELKKKLEENVVDQAKEFYISPN